MGIEEMVKEESKKSKLISKTISPGEISNMSDYRPIGLCKYLDELRIFRETSRPKIPLYCFSFAYS